MNLPHFFSYEKCTLLLKFFFFSPVYLTHFFIFHHNFPYPNLYQQTHFNQCPVKQDHDLHNQPYKKKRQEKKM